MKTNTSRVSAVATYLLIESIFGAYVIWRLHQARTVRKFLIEPKGSFELGRIVGRNEVLSEMKKEQENTEKEVKEDGSD